ncbi:hypothetical protein VNO77_29170 [Canavalia gladiata]|uniref:Uncharacterized protein n=1 Tax=Canavalia gladiata TaxID=3824 RepID=A0AAN9KZJ9_CANGL
MAQGNFVFLVNFGFNYDAVGFSDANENRIVTEMFQHRRILKHRYYLVEKAKDANIVGILVGTLGIDKTSQEQAKKAYTLVMEKPNPPKLANFPEKPSKSTPLYEPCPSKSSCANRICSPAFHEFRRFHVCSCLILCFASSVSLR